MALPNAAQTTVWGIEAPDTLEVREGDLVEVPVAVLEFQGRPEDRWQTVETAIRYDSARMTYQGIRPAHQEGVEGSGVPGRIAFSRDSTRTSDPARTDRRVTVRFEAAEPTQESGWLFVMVFRVRDLGADENGVTSKIGWDSASVSVGEQSVKPATQAPTDLMVYQRLEITLSAPMRALKQ